MKLYIPDLESEFINKKFKSNVNTLPDRGTVFIKNNYLLILSSKKIPLGFNIIGKLSALIEYECIRCLKKIPFNTEIKVNLILLNKLSFDKKKTSDMISINKNKEYYNINNVLADMIELSKPCNPLCKNKCKGLCFLCGQNLNFKYCKCKKEKTNNPFKILKNLQMDKN